MRVLAVNCGSSTLKFQVIEADQEEKIIGPELRIASCTVVRTRFLIRRLDLLRRMMFRIGFKPSLDPRVMKQYRMHHPTAASRAGVSAFPKMLPLSATHPNAQYINEIEETLATWDVPVQVMFSDKDMLFKVADGQRLASMVPNGRFQVVRNAGHYLQEDAGEEIAERMVTFLRDAAKVSQSRPSL